MRNSLATLALSGLVVVGLAAAGQSDGATPLGLPDLVIPEDNPQTSEKIALGDKLFNDLRFSATGDVACSTCHMPEKAFTDSPLSVSKGTQDQEGTRNAPTVLNAAYLTSQFWDGRSPDLEDQALHPFTNPIEHGLETHDPILNVVREDPEYQAAFKGVFGVEGDAVTMDHVTMAIAAFERTQVFGDSPFDRYWFGGEEGALTDEQKLGFDLFVNEARCVSCHVIEQTQALFTDNRFHNIGVGINAISDEVPQLTTEFLEADLSAEEVDHEVLSDPRTSEIGRFAVTHSINEVGAFKTSTLRNIALTAPYMHDGSLATLEDVVTHYNNGGALDPDEAINPYLSGGIRPLDLSDEEMAAVVAFMEALTSPEVQATYNPDAE